MNDANPIQNASLPRAVPETQGVSSPAVLAFLQAADRQVDELHSVMILRHGQVVAEGWWGPYAPDSRHLLFSLTKSFTSTAVGLAQAEGLLTIDAPVVSFFPELAPAKPSRALTSLTLRHLLTMSTGRLTESTDAAALDEAGDWVRGFLAQPLNQAPGAPFVYDSMASHVLAAVIQKVSGQTLEAYLRPRLFEPLGITDLTWESDPLGRTTGGWGLSLRTEDIAKFGQLYLQRGVWNGRSVVPASWVDEATAKQVATDRFAPGPNAEWNQGYGYQFWRCRHGAYRADGAFGQFCLVLPDQDAVIVFTSATPNPQAILNLVWKHLLPGLQSGGLSADPSGHRALAERLAGLYRPLPAGKATGGREARLHGRTFTLDANALGARTVGLEFFDGHAVLTVTDDRGVHRVEAGRRTWLPGRTGLFREPGLPLVRPASWERVTTAAFAWSSPKTLVFDVRLSETPFRYRLVFRFEADWVAVEGGVNVAFGPTESPRLVGIRNR